jgi:hypothetical protein
MDISQQEYQEVLKVYDNWNDYKAIMHTFKNRNLETCTEGEWILTLDKYFENKTDDKSRGLGDTVAKITKATGLDQLAILYTKVTGKPCGCASRQEALNKLVPYNITEES